MASKHCYKPFHTYDEKVFFTVLPFMKLNALVSSAAATAAIISVSYVTTASAAMMDSSSMMNMQSSKAGVMVGGAMMVPNLNIVENAVKAKNVTTVVAAVKAAGLVETLSSEGPFTVFAPTNAAFMRLPKGTVETLLKTENKQMLTDILTYHVVPGRMTVADLKNGEMLTTVNGDTLMVKKIGRNVWINGARISTRNVISSNGVTHVINRVLMPAM